MAITSLDGIVNALATARQKTPISKAGWTAQTVGGNTSMWRSAGNPAAGTTPTGPVSCNASTLGAIPFTQPAAGVSTYIARIMLGTATTAATAEIHDRLAHTAGLSGIVTTTQAVGIDLNALAGTDNLLQRRGRADYSTVQWWIEGIGQMGGTNTTATVAYTNHLGVAGTTTVFLQQPYRLAQLTPIVPVSGDYIRSVESITLSASTGVAGNFGVFASIQRTEITMPILNVGTLNDWSQTGLPPVYDNSCLFFIINVSGGTVGAINGAITLVQG